MFFFWHIYLHPREYIFRKFDWLTTTFVSLRYLLHFYFSFSNLGVFGGFLTLIGTMFLTGVYLFGNFSLSHTYLPILEKDSHCDWVTGQVEFTANIEPNPLVNWWMGYLNCQIEHHLFPSMPQHRQPSLVPRVREFCNRLGLKYRTLKYTEAVKLMFGNLKRVADLVDTMPNLER